ncbi:hypothetical protein ACTMSW_25335 [Micromonospora sp. BQ11]|uniref:hypothetical protein n=1 Tax=Micromonospora sp. BQ11 TaxID=3452212 RepID=UPI003F8A5B50
MDNDLITVSVCYGRSTPKHPHGLSGVRHVPNDGRLGMDLINRTADSTTNERSAIMKMTTIGTGRVQR